MDKKIFGKVKDLNVSGVTFNGRQGKIWNLKKNLNSGAYLTLRREPDNKHDPNAIKVIAHIPSINSHAHIGYVPAKVSFWLAKAMDNGRTYRTCNLRVVGGYGYHKNLGVMFDLAYELADYQVSPTYGGTAPKVV